MDDRHRPPDLAQSDGLPAPLLLHGDSPLPSSGIDYGALSTVSPDDVVNADVTCPRCGYNVRGLRRQARCPECGAPVELALQGDRIRFGEPAWVEGLARGARLILWSIVISILAAAANIAGGVAMAAPTAGLGSMLLGLLASAVQCFGAWLLTDPDPSGLGEAAYATSRRVVRVAAVIALFGSGMSGISAVAALGIVQMVVGMIAGLALLVFQVLYLILLIRLDRLLRNEAIQAREVWLPSSQSRAAAAQTHQFE